jgi:hypothetical protein
VLKPGELLREQRADHGTVEVAGKPKAGDETRSHAVDPPVCRARLSPGFPLGEPFQPGQGTLHVPEGEGPWPGVLVFTDIFGPRDVFAAMGDRLASLGYVALIPDVYYRKGGYAPFDIKTAFSDAKERNRLFGLASRNGTGRRCAPSTVRAWGNGPADQLRSDWIRSRVTRPSRLITGLVSA